MTSFANFRLQACLYLKGKQKLRKIPTEKGERLMRFPYFLLALIAFCMVGFMRVSDILTLISASVPVYYIVAFILGRYKSKL